MEHKLGFVIYTYNRINDAKINMEIIKNVWEKNPRVTSTKIVHTYNGKKEWYLEKYLEDSLVVSENPGHFQGASDLMDIGFETIVKEYPETEYLIILAADCWLTNPEPILNIIDNMKTKGYKVATSIWGEKDSLLKDKGFATDFFIVDVAWANKYKLFPFKYEEFSNKHREILWYMSVVLMVEKLALLRFTEAIYTEEPSINKLKKNIAEKLLLIKDRDPIYQEKDQYGGWSLRNTYPEIGLVNHHNPYKKRKAIKELNFSINTPVFSNFIDNENLSDFVADEVQKKPVES